jgi:hypothetical protein
MSTLKKDSICARRRFNPLARCELVFALSQVGPRRRRRRKLRGGFARRRFSQPVVARV